MENGIELLLVDKPKGITSFDVIRRLRSVYKEKTGEIKAPKMGHSGTLDPLASGLMVLGVGSGTKKLAELIKLDKEYIAEVLVGESRTTGDMEGEVVESREVPEALEILRSKISSALDSMKGDLVLPVSAYSAIKVDGVPMYKRARKAERQGSVIEEVPVRTMKVYESEILDCFEKEGKKIFKIKFSVSSGTYIRSLAEELGKRIGYPATLYNLRRTKVGSFSIEDAKTIDEAF